MIARLHEYHPKLAWSTFSTRADALLAPLGAVAPLALTQWLPDAFWDVLPPDELEAWLKAHVPAQLSANVARGMDTVRIRTLEKATLVHAADAFLAARTHD
jgi:hypothetical protein